MRYTIPGTQNDRARVTVRNRLTPRGEWWAIIRRGDLLNGLMGRDHLPPVHRERVRFGAWEGRPRSRARVSWRVGVWREGHEVMAEWRDECAGRTWGPLDLTPYVEEFRAAVKAITDVYLQSPAAVAAVERSLAQTGTGEGPPISGPENAYKCEGER